MSLLARLKVKFFKVFYTYGQNSVWKWIPWFYNVGNNGKIRVKLFPSSHVVTVSKLVSGLASDIRMLLR